MRTKKIFLFKSNVFIVVSFIQFFLFVSCNKEEDVLHYMTEYPSDIISTPIFTSNFPTEVIESQTPINVVSSTAITFIVMILRFIMEI